MPRRSARLAAQAAVAAPCPLLQLDDDVLEVVGHQISDALRPAVAGALAACNHNLWRVMQAPLARLQARHAAARALAAKVGYLSFAGLSQETWLRWHHKGLDAADMATLAMLFSTGALARVERLWLAGNRLGPAGASALLAGLGCGDAPRLILLDLRDTALGNEGASALAAALTRGALPKLEALYIGTNALGDEAMAVLARPLRCRPGLRKLNLSDSRIGDNGVAALVDNLGDKELKQLVALYMVGTLVGDAGCGTLAAALNAGALPALRLMPYQASLVYSNSASTGAKAAVANALRANEERRSSHAAVP